MTRTHARRVELMVPVEDKTHKALVLHTLHSMFRDTVKRRQLNADGIYVPVTPADGEEPFRVQYVLQEEAHRRAAQARERAGITFTPVK